MSKTARTMSDTSSQLALYGGTWAAGAAVLGAIMQIGKLPVQRTAAWKRFLIAALLAGIIVAAVYAAKEVEARSSRIARDVALKHGVRVAAGRPKAAKKSVTKVVRTGLSNAAALVRQRRAGASQAAPESGATPSAAMASRVTPSEAKGSSEAASPASPDPPATASSGTPSTTAGAPASPATLERQVQRDDEAHDARVDEEHSFPGMVGGVRRGAFTDRVMPRRVEITRGYLGQTAGAGKLAELLTFEGMRDVRDSTLFAREAYKTHQWHEPGEGMDQRYTDPSLARYDPAFAAYSDQPFVPQRATLSGNAPAAF